MANRKRICIVISGLRVGGAELTAANFANYWTTQGHDVKLLYFGDEGVEPVSFPAKNIQTVRIPDAAASGILMKTFRFVQRVRALRKAIRTARPDTVISFGDLMNVFTICALRGRGPKLIISERTTPPFAPLSATLGALRRVTYPYAGHLVVQSSAAAMYFEGWMKEKVSIIPNPLFLPEVQPSLAPYGQRKHRIVGLGRLSAEKGFDMLIRAFALVAEKYPEWELIIYGEGPERETLEKIRRELRFANRIRLPGETGAPWEELSKARIFVLSSHFEGFPTALVQAMASGMSVISTQCPGAPPEIIRDNVDGLLVDPLIEALRGALERIMGNKGLGMELADRALEVKARYSPEKIMPMWERLFE